MTRKEERLVLRRRKMWHKVIRHAWHSFSALCALLLVTYSVFVYGKFKEQLAYQDIINAIPASGHTGGPPTFSIEVDHYSRETNADNNESQEARLVADHLQLFRLTLDSLGLSRKVLGFDLAVQVVPFHSFGRRHCTSQLGVYTTTCGCENDILDYTVLVIDSTGTHVSTISTLEVVSANIQP